jgi:NTP pyrophosphatase (non-canonical NTP hydrolase)
MTFDDYQAGAARTSAAPFPERERLMVQTLGLCGEAGEIADLVKKATWHGRILTNEELTNELGDVLWYLADLATSRGINLADVAEHNLDKLARRYPDGFTVGGGIR